MSSDLGKMYRRNYMVKSQLRSLTEKSKALNARIDGDTNIDEWAESYITRADAQIDDVSDYMNYRNLGNLTDNLPLVTAGSTAGALLMLSGMGAVWGLVTYSEYKSQKKLTDSAKARLKRMAIYAGVGAGIGTIYKGIVGTGQATGYY